MKRLVVAFVAAVLLVGCGGSDSPIAPQAVPTPQGPMFTEVVGTVEPDNLMVHQGYAAGNGHVSVVLTWSGPADLDLGAADTNGNITAPYENESGNRKEVRFTASAGQRFVVGIYSYGASTATNYKINIESPRSVTANQMNEGVEGAVEFPRHIFKK